MQADINYHCQMSSQVAQQQTPRLFNSGCGLGGSGGCVSFEATDTSRRGLADFGEVVCGRYKLGVPLGRSNEECRR